MLPDKVVVMKKGLLVESGPAESDFLYSPTPVHQPINLLDT